MSTSARPLSPRLSAVVEALPLGPGLRVLEVGGAPGAAAREVARRVAPRGHVLVLDRSPVGIERTRAGCADLVAAGLLSTLCAEVEEFELAEDVARFDLAFACRVGVLDGRHPRRHQEALARVRRALVPGGALYVDGGDPLRRLDLG